MSRVGTTTNLEVGGKYDLLMVKFTGTFPEGEISFGLYDTPMKITGLQKVAQIFLRTLLTTKGSDPFYANRGTSLPNLIIGSNLLEDSSTLSSDVQDAVNDAARQVREYLNANNADSSSSLDSVYVLGLDVVDEGLVMYLYLVTLSGEFAQITVPFPEFGISNAL